MAPEGNAAVKLSTGEPPASNYLRPELIAGLVQYVDGTIVECNTAYGGSRAETAMHYHTGGTSKRGINGNQDAFPESMGEAGKAVVDALDGHVMNRLSVDCDCSGNPADVCMAPFL